MARLTEPKRRANRGDIEPTWSNWLDQCHFRSIPEAAAALGMSPYTLKRWAKRKPTEYQRWLMAAIYHRLEPWK